MIPSKFLIIGKLSMIVCKSAHRILHYSCGKQNFQNIGMESDYRGHSRMYLYFFVTFADRFMSMTREKEYFDERKL